MTVMCTKLVHTFEGSTWHSANELVSSFRAVMLEVD